MVSWFPQCLLLFLPLLILQEEPSSSSNVERMKEKGTIEKAAAQKQQHRKLLEYPFYDWYQNEVSREEEITASESIQNGRWANLTCPLGTYREFGSVKQRIPGGLRLEGCIPCPPGVYGNSSLLFHKNCTAPCPKGTYRPYSGGISIQDCFPCPRGTYGESMGLTTDQCSGSCSDLNTDRVRFYGDSVGLDSKDKCRPCPPGYHNLQCHTGPFINSLSDNSVLYGSIRSSGSRDNGMEQNSFSEKIRYYRLYEKQRQQMTPRPNNH